MFEAWLFVLAHRERLPDTVDFVLYDLSSIFAFIIQQIVTMPIYGKEALNICHPT